MSEIRDQQLNLSALLLPGFGVGAGLRYFLACWLFTGNWLTAIVPALIAAGLVFVRDYQALITRIGSALLMLSGLYFAGVFSAINNILIMIFRIF